MSAEDPRPACDLLLVVGLVLTLDAADRIIPDGAIAVAADRIVDIGPSAAIEPRWRGPRGRCRRWAADMPLDLMRVGQLTHTTAGDY